jgi:hypothetical protein
LGHRADIDDSALLERSLAAGTWLEGLLLNELLAWRETW